MVPPAPGWKQNFRFVWLNNFITAVGMMAFLPMFPFLLGTLGLEDPAEVGIWSGLLFAGAPLTAAVFGPFWGVLSDRVGHKLMMLRANAAIVLCVGLMSQAGSVWTLLLLRVLQGLASGFVAPSMTLVSVSAPEDQQGRVAGSLHTAVLAGGVIGPTIGGYVSDHFGVRNAFLFCAALNLVALVVTLVFVREPEREPVERSREWGEFGRKVLVQVTSLFQPGPLRSMLLSLFVIRLGVGLIEPVLTLHVEDLQTGDVGWLATLAGMAFAAAWLPTLVLTPWLGRVGDRRGHGALLVKCAFGTAFFYAAQALATTVLALVALRFLAGACFAGVFPAAYGIASQQSSREGRGGAFGVTFSSLVLANGLGAVSGGWLASWLGIRALFSVAAALMLVASLRLLVRERRAKLRWSHGDSGSPTTPGAPP